jgi:GDP-4-dehydro-6-deoxy-D-mannose reductase
MGMEERTNMRFLVTGISGFVAPYLAKYLLANDHEVYGMLHNSPLGAVDGIQYVTGDLCDIRTFKYLREYNFDGVFHLAGLTHPPTSFKEPELYYKTNATGTMNLCEVFQQVV